MAATTVTVVFTDLVGSTALMSRLGEVAADSLRREHFDLLRTAIAEVGGNEVKNLGDGLMVTFEGVGAGLACAVAMQQAMAGRSPSAEPLSIRVGVATGEADSEGDDYFGLPVVEAARLCARAEGGEILCTEMVRLLTRSRGGFDLEPVGDLELKGLDEPVTTYRVRWEALASVEGAAWPLPVRVASLASQRFVGRTGEWEALLIDVKEARTGERRCVLLSGEPGIGKTTLAARFAVDAAAAGVSVLYGRCDADLFVPYQPWAEALGHVVEHAPPDLIRDHVERFGTVLGRVIPAVWGRIEAHAAEEVSVEDDSDRARFFAAVVDLLARVSASVPLMVILDDLHWADAGTVDLLRHVLAVNQSLAVLVVGTFRDADVGPGDPLAVGLAALHRERGVRRVHLRGLGDDDLYRLLEYVAGHDLGPDGTALRDALLAETEGNPFFVWELLRHLSDTGALVQDDTGRWTVSDSLRTAGLPVSIREVVGQRVRSLGADTHALLTVASVIGRDFDLDLLERICDVDADRIVDLCDAAVGIGLLRDRERGDGYTFAHALVEHALYEELTAARRARTHRAVAEALEDLTSGDPGTRIGELAHHWAQATRPADAAKAIDYATRAGDQALASLAPDDAVRWYSQGLELLSDARDVSRRARLLVGLGDAQRLSGDPVYRRTLADAAVLAEQAGDTDLLVAAALASCRDFADAGLVDADLVALLERATERLGDVDTPERARLLAYTAVQRAFGDDDDAVRDLALEAISVARRSADRTTLAAVLARCCSADRHPSRLATRREWLEEASDLASALGNSSLDFGARTEQLVVALALGDLPLIRASWARASAAAELSPQAPTLWNLAFHGVWMEVLAGDLVSAEREAERALQLGVECGQPDAMAIYGVGLTNIRLHGGGIEELLPLMEDAAQTRPGLSAYRAVITQSLALSGRHDEARHQLDDSQASGFATRSDHSTTITLAAWAEAAFRTGHPSARTLHDRLQPFHAQIVSALITVQPAVAYYLGRLDLALGRHDDAQRWLIEAETIHWRMESPLLIAYSDVAMAALLADRDRPGDTEQARAMAERALVAARTGGFAYIERDARLVLEQLSG